MEIIVAIALAGVILGLGGALVFQALQSGEKARVQAIAGRLAQGEMEAASAIASSDWHKIYCPPAGVGSGNCSSLKGTGNKYYARSTLMACWPMDELSGTTVGDTSGSGNAGTATRSDNIGDGKNYKARQFNGTSDYVSVPIPQLSNNVGTFEEWVKPIGWTGGDGSYHGSFQTRTPGNWVNNVGQIIVLDQWSDTFYFRIVPDAGCCPIDVTFSTAGVFTDGQWTHIAATWNKPANEIKVYINGELKESRSDWTQAVTTPVEPTGYIGIGHDRYYAGIIDEVRIYKRVLPQYEIQRHYLHPADVVSKTPLAGQETLTFAGNNYTRYFTVDNVSRDLTAQNIEPAYNVLRDDPSTQKITVTVSADRFLASSSISQYVTRSRNAIYDQTDWSAGVISDTPYSYPPAGYATGSANIDVSSPGSVKILNP